MTFKVFTEERFKKLTQREKTRENAMHVVKCAYDALPKEVVKELLKTQSIVVVNARELKEQS